MRQRITFHGNFAEYFLIALALIALSAVTFGLALPYLPYWSLKYFFTKLRIGDRQVAYTGNVAENFLMALGLMVLSVITFGLALPYYAYWLFKYFFTRLELVEAGATAGRPQEQRTVARPAPAEPVPAASPVLVEPPRSPAEVVVAPPAASAGSPRTPALLERAQPEAREDPPTESPAPQTFQFRSPR